MKTKAFAAVCTAALILVLGQSGHCQDTPATTHLTYPKYGIAVDIPAGAAKQTSQSQPGGMMEVYTSGGLALAVFVIKGEGGMSPQTLLEQVLTMISTVAPETAMKRWQANTPQKVPFGGFTLTIPRNAASQGHAEGWVKQILGDEPGVQSAAVVTLPNKPDYAMGVAVLGPKSREGDVLNMARWMISTTKLAGLPTYSGASLDERQKATEYPHPTLKPGDIALGGVVDVMGGDGKHMTILVEEVTAYGKKPVRLHPSRSKEVLLETTAAGAGPGVHVLVVGKNTGTGEAIHADAVHIVGSAAPASPKK